VDRYLNKEEREAEEKELAKFKKAWAAFVKKIPAAAQAFHKKNKAQFEKNFKTLVVQERSKPLVEYDSTVDQPDDDPDDADTGCCNCGVSYRRLLRAAYQKGADGKPDDRRQIVYKGFKQCGGACQKWFCNVCWAPSHEQFCKHSNAPPVAPEILPSAPSLSSSTPSATSLFPFVQTLPISNFGKETRSPRPPTTHKPAKLSRKTPHATNQCEAHSVVLPSDHQEASTQRPSQMILPPPTPVSLCTYTHASHLRDTPHSQNAARFFVCTC
jgi:hypothetical protein